MTGDPLSRIRLVEGDITRVVADAIVNAANSTLVGGGGVDGAIHRAGGPEILAACRLLRAGAYARGLPPGEAVITTAGRLRARHVIHTVGPVWAGGLAGEATVLARCYANSLSLAAAHGLESVAFPSISTGAYGYPVAKAAAIALGAVREALERPSSLALVRFALWSDADLATYAAALGAL
jgi:O-acetyl-ADP-ribose deacetylase